MSGPTQPDGSDGAPKAPGQGPASPEATTPATNDNAAVGGTAPQDAAAGTEQAPQQQRAYVDPSIAADVRVVELEAQVGELKDRYVRAHADMENLRKRTEREKADASKYAITKFAMDMLAVADNLERAIEATPTEQETDANVKPLLEGIKLTSTDLKNALERHGVRRIESAGSIFDPNFHQAVMEEENKEVAAGTILKVFQEGYQIGDRVLRPSMVVVAKGGFKPVKPAAPDDAATSGESETEVPGSEPSPGGDGEAPTGN